MGCFFPDFDSLNTHNDQIAGSIAPFLEPRFDGTWYGDSANHALSWWLQTHEFKLQSVEVCWGIPTGLKLEICHGVYIYTHMMVNQWDSAKTSRDQPLFKGIAWKQPASHLLCRTCSKPFFIWVKPFQFSWWNPHFWPPPAPSKFCWSYKSQWSQCFVW